jgi:hypothetical protein
MRRCQRSVRHRRSVTIVTLIVGLMMFGVAPVHADQPFELEQNTTYTHHDFVNNLAVFWNITRDAFCEDPGNPDIGTDTFVVMVHGAGQDGGFTSESGTAYLELWDISGIEDQNGDSCDMTEQDGAALWATGDAKLRLADRTLQSVGNQPFSFAFLNKGDGTVEDDGGQLWDYKWVFEMLQQDGGGFHITSQHLVLKAAR